MSKTIGTTKTVAVMQPYFFPYLGYFQLIYACDVLVLYDDVNFIKQGWINRNRIVVNGKEYLFTVPLLKASSFKNINDTRINPILFSKWKIKFLKTVEQNYKDAPYFQTVFKLIRNTFDLVEYPSIAELAKTSIEKTLEYLQISRVILESSKKFSNSKGMDKELRLFAICNSLDSNNYVNLIGGQNLYDKVEFKKHGILLEFLEPIIPRYQQFQDEFIPGMSIIDVLMFNSIEDINGQIKQYNLI